MRAFDRKNVAQKLHLIGPVVACLASNHRLLRFLFPWETSNIISLLFFNDLKKNHREFERFSARFMGLHQRQWRSR